MAFLSGPRQSGKSALAKMALPNARYSSYDAPKDVQGTSMYCVKGESEKTLHRGDFKRKHHYRGCILPRVRVQ